MMMIQRKRIFPAINNRIPSLLMILRRWSQKEISQMMVQEVMAPGTMVQEVMALVDLRIKMMMILKDEDNPLRAIINNLIECQNNHK